MREVVIEEDSLQWHYTSTAGLLGILATNSLWASDAATLNDSTEIRFGMDLVRSRLPTRLEEASAWADLAGTRIDGAEVPAAIANMLGLVEGFLLSGGLYVFCASLSGDSLSQWRGYGHGSDAGFAIGLRRDPLDYKWPGHVDLSLGVDSAVDRPLGMSLHPAWRDVIYDRIEQETAADRFFTSMASIMARIGVPSGNETDIQRGLMDLASMLTWSYGELVSSMKDEAFAEEREVRIALGGPHLPGRANLRTGRYGPLAFVELAAPDQEPVHFDSHGIPYQTFTTQGLGVLPIEVVRIGPTPQPQMARDGLHSALARYGYDNVQVVQSEVPFR
ncbi:MAG TPA: hypothetical protein VIJ07_24065 [Dermatophilaceae bacterium]